MRFSVWPNLQQSWAEVLEVARHAEQVGYDGVYVADHFMGDGGGFGSVETPTLEATAALSALATATERVRLGSLVFGTTYRHPAVLANWAATTDVISGGRLVLGVGAGWQTNEHDQYGIDLPAVGPRVDRFAETCQVLHGLLRTPVTSFDGDWFQMTDAVCEPKPAQQPLPLLIGGKGNRMLGVTARFADEWNMWSVPAQLSERRAVLDERCERIDRDPATIATSTQALVMLTDDQAQADRFLDAVAPRAAVAGGDAQIADLFAGWQEVGVDEVIIPDAALGRGPARLDRLDRLINDIAPPFR